MLIRPLISCVADLDVTIQYPHPPHIFADEQSSHVQRDKINRLLRKCEMANGMCRAEKRGIAKSRTNRRQRTIRQHYKKTSGQHSQRRTK